MKLPKSFKPETDLEKKTEQLIEESKNFKGYDVNAVNGLLEIFDDFVKVSAVGHTYPEIYYLSFELAGQCEYAKSDIEEAVRLTDLSSDYDYTAGITISAFINKIIVEDDIFVLSPKTLLESLGMYLRKGKLIIEEPMGDYIGMYMAGGEIEIYGDSNQYTGHQMTGGEIIVKGNAGYAVGSSMIGGKIIVEGDAGGDIGEDSRGGEIWIDGKIGELSKLCEAKIFEKDTQIWPHDVGQLIKDLDNYIKRLDQKREKYGFPKKKKP